MVEQRRAANQRQAKARPGGSIHAWLSAAGFGEGADPRDACCIPVGNGPAENVRWQRAVQFRWRLLARARSARSSSGLASWVERWRAIALAELVSVRLDDQRQVQVAWLWQAEDFLQIKLARRRIEQVGAVTPCQASSSTTAS